MSTFFFNESLEFIRTISQYQAIIGVLFLLWPLWILTTKRREVNSSRELSDEVVNFKLNEWKPEPLIPESPDNYNIRALTPRCVSSRVGKYVTVNDKKCLNFGTHNYLGLVENKEVEKKAIATIQKYGVGSCGPRGFYGTVDIHLELEKRLAKFMDSEDAIVYSYGFSAIASAIPAYCKRKAIVFCDERVNFAIQKGLDAAKSKVQFFKHNDLGDLERLLKERAAVDKRDEKKAAKIRRFLIVEGIYINTGMICPLPGLLELCRKYKLRIFVDESVSFGTLGKTGKGVTEYYGIARSKVDLIMGSLEGALGTIGGFCVGSSFVIEHQVLSGLGYCFSASLPPLLASAAITGLDLIENNPRLFTKLHENCIKIDLAIRKLAAFELSGIPESPIKHLYLANKYETTKEESILDKITDKCLTEKLALVRPNYLSGEHLLPRPSIRLCISALLEDDEIDNALETLTRITQDILSEEIYD